VPVPHPAEIRRFRRDDRDQLTALVNAHVQAVVPGIVVPTNLILNQIEREPGEFIVDPWVDHRITLVAEQRGRVVAAAHLLNYRNDADVGSDYRGAGEIRWLLQWPPAPYWPDADEAGSAVLLAALEVLAARSSARSIRCDPSLPAPGVYGVPQQWPHIEQLLLNAGFHPGPRTEIINLADTARLATDLRPMSDLQRSVGINGTRLAIEHGYIEVQLIGNEGFRAPGLHGWADVGNLHVDPEHRRRGIGRALLAHAATWLQLGHVDRLLHYTDTDDTEGRAFAAAVGFTELSRTRRGWLRP
jgi:GNAT superfamily N-acetyltransferase